MTTTELRTEAGFRRQRLDRMLGHREVIWRMYRERQVRKERLQGELEVTKRAEAFLLRVAASAQDAVKTHMERMVTDALCHVYGPGYAFTMEWTGTGKTRGVTFSVTSPYEGGSLVMGNPRDAEGGGVQDVIGFTLWLLLLEMTGHSGPIAMDEPLKWVGKDHTPKLVHLIRSVQEGLGRQVFMVTSHQNIALSDLADRLFLVEKVDGVSKIEEVVE